MRRVVTFHDGDWLTETYLADGRWRLVTIVGGGRGRWAAILEEVEVVPSTPYREVPPLHRMDGDDEQGCGA